MTPETLGIFALHETVIAASPADVRNRFQAQEIDPELDFIRSGFAAGCEAGLRPAVDFYPSELGYAPG